jgi:predicted DNA-binding antitoxin AbrB/MazE fold protein
MLGKTFRAKVKGGHIEPLEPVDLSEGEELEVTVETADETNEWLKEIHALFAPVREELADVPEKEIDRRVARAVKAVRAKRRAKT